MAVLLIALEKHLRYESDQVWQNERGSPAPRCLLAHGSALRYAPCRPRRRGQPSPWTTRLLERVRSRTDSAADQGCRRSPAARSPVVLVRSSREAGWWE